MPLYEFACPTGHATIALRKMDDHTPPPCDTCGQPTTLRPSVPAAGIVTGSPNPVRSTPTPNRDGFQTTYESPTFIVREKGKGLTRMDYMCENGHVHGDDYEVLPDVCPACPKCGAISARTINGVPDIDWFTKEHPGGYFEPGLGRFIRSRAHMKEVMAELGLVEMDWRQPMEDQRRRDSAMAEREDAVVRDMIGKWEHGPDSAAIKEARDRNGEADWGEYLDALGIERMER